MKKIVLCLLPIVVLAEFNELPPATKYQYKEDVGAEIPRAHSNKVVVTKIKSSMNMAISDLLASDRKIEELLERQEKNLIVRASKDRIKSLTRVRGVVLNSILAMNIRPTAFVVKIHSEVDAIGDGELRCSGINFQKRIPAKCDLLVTEDSEFEVDVNVWDVDGAEGIIADYFYSGEEKTFLTSGLAAFFEGALDATKERLQTPFGETAKNNGKNKVLSGLTNVAGNVGELIKSSGEQDLSIAYVNAGKEVLLFFNQGLDLTKEDK
ncbi:MAG: hypothetical protein A2504_00385 [Bdellovibrionales bacterium RIFOXYD12_FULL_39_22]|nr:MAG: hypothetical protein A2385_13965 [Bdellovibrionales bacterium RIFOXYB1_FULL_39_21]OFZ42438.1 MAG: hypothetical protein A2485_04015 [Bdellovibrionales bacterium RIFOXYC12_FULL_39_17]OFZ45414.1 MAG: hypothetical protein A2404_01455 [Bdellovibrionales bacterium RIFOXYC1_FULL_39_130]OFZ68426.1 MAG: hypothetical protein A2451_01590 [Bdellovibrionales bacterium RIFOXYC2_FULL_39_8]OFZ74611.1 MAG: hypothetical protein A2560_09485 [Bdellovibrionales bacterium RIFOXYD1_FULL_39_84]OFZ92893.1 MAG: